MELESTLGLKKGCFEMTKTKAAPKSLAYAAPKLVIYGEVKKLTAGGSLGNPENGSSTLSKARP